MLALQVVIHLLNPILHLLCWGKVHLKAVEVKEPDAEGAARCWCHVFALLVSCRAPRRSCCTRRSVVAA